MPDEAREPVKGRLGNAGELAAWVVMAAGAAFVPGIVVAVVVAVILAIAQLAG